MFNKLARRKTSSGFTMIEIMVVVVIVAILAAIAIPIYVKYVESARASEAKSVIGNLYNASKMYYQTTGRWPDNVDQLENSGQIQIDLSTKNQWTFTLDGLDVNAGTITATSSDQMEGGADHVVTFDCETASYSGYGTPNSEQ